MDEASREHFRRKLVELRQQVNRRIAAEQPQAQEDLGEVGDPADLAVTALRRDTAVREADRLSGLFAAIDEALVRLQRGEYGRCESCGGEIERERLEALPTARTCRDCAAAETQPPGPTI